MDGKMNTEELFRNIFDRCCESIIIFNPSGNILKANNIAMEETGYYDEIKIANITDIYPMGIRMYNKKVKFDQTNSFISTFAYRKNKTCYPVKLKCIWYEHENSKIGICFGINDSERYDAVKSHQKAMDEVAIATKMKNEFTANITHELRTPINGIKGMAESLSDTQMTLEQIETVGIIIKCCNNMSKIINDILDFSKIEAGKLTIESKEFDVWKFFNDILIVNSVRTGEKGLQLIVDIDKSIPAFLIGDELRLGQILNNLLSNAIKFTSIGHIGLEVSNNQINDNETELLFMVIDTGIGISPDETDKLFASFSQVDGTITRRFGGTGLGLAICKQLVELMGGTIRVESEKGKGSIFSFTINFKIGKNDSTSENFPEGRFIYKKSNALAVKKSDEAKTENSISTISNHLLEDMFDSESIEVDNYRTMKEIIEKLKICIDLENWEKAESFSTVIRNLSMQEAKEWRRDTFALLLNIRKENRDKAIELISLIEAYLEEKEKK